MTAQLMMVLLFLFFFSEATLGFIAVFTNAKTTEIVHKVKTQRSDGKYYYKVRVCVRVRVWIVYTECLYVCAGLRSTSG